MTRLDPDAELGTLLQALADMDRYDNLRAHAARTHDYGGESDLCDAANGQARLVADCARDLHEYLAAGGELPARWRDVHPAGRHRAA